MTAACTAWILVVLRWYNTVYIVVLTLDIGVFTPPQIICEVKTLKYPFIQALFWLLKKV